MCWFWRIYCRCKNTTEINIFCYSERTQKSSVQLLAWTFFPQQNRRLYGKLPWTAFFIGRKSFLFTLIAHKLKGNSSRGGGRKEGQGPYLLPADMPRKFCRKLHVHKIPSPLTFSCKNRVFKILQRQEGVMIMGAVSSSSPTWTGTIFAEILENTGNHKAIQKWQTHQHSDQYFATGFTRGSKKILL